MNRPNQNSWLHALRWLRLLLLAGILLGLIPLLNASAQSAWTFLIHSPDSSQFPRITFLMEIYDENGNFVTGLTADEIEIVEDGYTRRLEEIVQVEPGIHFIAAINEAPMMTNHYGGISYYNRFFQTLVDWAASQAPDGPDVFSLSTNTGVQAVRVPGGLQFAQALNQYNSNVLQQRPNLNSLSQALDLVTDSTADPTRKCAILYITSIPDEDSVRALPNLITRAVQLGVQVSVWLVDPSISAHARLAEPLLQMTEQTGGTFFVLTGGEVFPDLNADLLNLRYNYRVSYFSQASQSGEHTFIVNVHRGDFTAGSQPQTFTIDVQPPNPIFLDPPIEIRRIWVEDQEKNQEPFLSPETQPLEILIEFPDNHPRDLRASRLYVDEKLEIEHTSPPFDRFTWSLTSYTASETHVLRVEVEDILGLTRSTLDTQVSIVVEELKLPWWKTLLNSRGWIAIAAVLVSLAILTGVMIIASRRSRGKTQRLKRKKTRTDPLTQPLRASTPTRKIPLRPAAAVASPTLPLAPPPFASTAPARLVRITENHTLMENHSIPLNRKEFTFGRDPQQAICVLDSPSVDALHARLVQTEDGTFLLSDMDSTAGTWVNYQPVPKTGVQLFHGDVIFFGRLSFRFEMSNPPYIPQPEIKPYREETL